MERHLTMRNYKFEKDTKDRLSTLIKYLVLSFSAITVIAIFVPLNPKMPYYAGMPYSDLDASWIFSMNEAVDKNLSIGKDVIFTFGPYTSIYSSTYHPATDSLMVTGSLFLGLCYFVTLLYLAKDKKPYGVLVFSLFLSGFMYSRDALFFSYPLILATCVAKFAAKTDQLQHREINLLQAFAIFLVFAPLGLLPLVKGSLLLICGGMLLLIFFFLLYKNCYKLAAIILMSPIVSTVIFWIFSGQPILYLPNFFTSMSPIISNYTEAMAVNGNFIEIIIYFLAAMVIYWALLRSSEITIYIKLFLSICLSLFLFVAFKGGFVRHDQHAIMSATSLVFAPLILGVAYSDKRITIALVMSFASFILIDGININTPPRNMLEENYSTYYNAWSGLKLRMTDKNALQSKYEHNLGEIQDAYTVPALEGTTDIYSYGQIYLFASNNRWNPRPVLQSYSAYTPQLASLDEQHLRSTSAPDNILFNVQPIDGRMPSLEDGLSWPALIDNYMVTDLDNGYTYLRKRQTLQSKSIFTSIYSDTQKTGEEVFLPSTNLPMYAEIDLKPTLLGKISSILFKPPQLKLTLKLKDGTVKDYRVLANMMQSGFFVSPLIKDSKDFVLLATGNQIYLANNIVESITITPEYGGTFFWKETYILKLKSYLNSNVYALPENFFNNIADATPEGYKEFRSSSCDGFMLVNDTPPGTQKITTSGQLSVNGWLNSSTEDSVIPDDIFVTLISPQGDTKYIEAHYESRNDAITYFQQPAIPDVRFTMTADVTMLSGEYILGLARGYEDRIEQCEQFNTPLTIDMVY